jgi:hypothetical protein
MNKQQKMDAWTKNKTEVQGMNKEQRKKHDDWTERNQTKRTAEGTNKE